MNKFKVGDWVAPKEPSPGFWSSLYKNIEGKPFRIKKVNPSGFYVLDGAPGEGIVNWYDDELQPFHKASIIIL